MEGEEEILPVTSLERLIMILAHASPSYLGGAVEDLENLTRNELLNKIKVLNKDFAGGATPADILKKILKEWAMHSKPSQVKSSITVELTILEEF